MSRTLSMYSAIAATLSVIAVGYLLFREKHTHTTEEYLIYEKVSLLDRGIEDLEKSMGRANTPLLKKHGELAFYDTARNRIILTSSTTWEKAPSPKDAMEWCVGLIREMKSNLSVDPNSGKLTPGNSSTVYLSFQHAGYRSPAEPARFRTDLDQMVVLGATVHVTGKSSGPVHCRSRLLEKEIEFKNAYDQGP